MKITLLLVAEPGIRLFKEIISGTTVGVFMSPWADSNERDLRDIV